MPEHKPYTVKAETYRHYRKGDTVLLRDHVAEKLVDEKVVEPKAEDKPKRKAKAG